MDLFISFCRGIAAIFITNAHYQRVYPFSALASGGLLGDVIFFAVSGYCIYGIKLPFGNWYRHRLRRVYPAVWISSAVFLLLGFYDNGGIGGAIRLSRTCGAGARTGESIYASPIAES